MGFLDIIYCIIHSDPVWIVLIVSRGFQLQFSHFLCRHTAESAAKYYLLAFVIIKIGPKVRMIFKLNMKPILVIASVCIVIALLVTRII